MVGGCPPLLRLGYFAFAFASFSFSFSRFFSRFFFAARFICTVCEQAIEQYFRLLPQAGKVTLFLQTMQMKVTRSNVR
jgi:hypothetical protein